MFRWMFRGKSFHCFIGELPVPVNKIGSSVVFQDLSSATVDVIFGKPNGKVLGCSFRTVIFYAVYHQLREGMSGIFAFSITTHQPLKE